VPRAAGARGRERHTGGGCRATLWRLALGVPPAVDRHVLGARRSGGGARDGGGGGPDGRHPRRRRGYPRRGTHAAGGGGGRRARPGWRRRVLPRPTTAASSGSDAAAVTPASLPRRVCTRGHARTGGRPHCGRYVYKAAADHGWAYVPTRVGRARAPSIRHGTASPRHLPVAEVVTCATFLLAGRPDRGTTAVGPDATTLVPRRQRGCADWLSALRTVRALSRPTRLARPPPAHRWGRPRQLPVALRASRRGRPRPVWSYRGLAVGAVSTGAGVTCGGCGDPSAAV